MAAEPHPDDNDQQVPIRRRFFLVDDHELLRMGLAQLISGQMNWEVCGQAGEGPAAITMIRELLPDVAIVDLRLQRGDGLELIKQIRASVPSVRILVFSMHDEDLYAERSLRAGAHGYLSKEAPLSTLLEAVRRVSDGKISLSPRMMERILSRQSGASEQNTRPLLERLSDREMEVFERLGRGMSAKQIAQELQLSAKTVEYHRQHIKEKLQVASSSAVVRIATAHALGLSPQT